MRVLLVKLTSMGDVLHVLPAVNDLVAHYPEVEIDWMVEDSFSEIPYWNKNVCSVIPVSTRRWRRLNLTNVREFFSFLQQARQSPYDYIVDAQGLMKSAALARFAKLAKGGQRIGFSADSIKERSAAKLYTTTITVPRDIHAITRLRLLFSEGFGYSTDTHLQPSYAVREKLFPKPAQDSNTILFFPSTTWPSKHLNPQIWRDLVKLVVEEGYKIKISWGSNSEFERAEWIAQGHNRVEVLPKSCLNDLAKELRLSAGAIAVDTGLGHMAAALGVPAVSVYGSTDAKLTGAIGDKQTHLQCDYPCSPCLLKKCNKLTSQIDHAPCYETYTAGDIWAALHGQII